MDRIAVIGAGIVGRTLAKAWVSAGHEVVFGSRNAGPEPVDGIGVLASPEAIARSSVVVYTVPGQAMPELLAEHGPHLDGRIVLDATNNLAPDRAGISAIGRITPQASAYRVFNSIGWEVMADPAFPGGTADLFFAGPDGPTRNTVQALIADVGFTPVWVGDGADAHAVVDALSGLWFALVFGQGQPRRLALRILTD